MKKNHVIALSIVILIAGIVWFLERPDRPQRGDLKESPLLIGFDPAVVQKIELERLFSGVVLVRDNDQWLVQILKTTLSQDQPTGPQEVADRQKVDNMLKLLSNLKIGSLVSQNPEKATEYQVNNTSLQVKVLDRGDNKLFHFHIGKNGPEILSTYIRREGEDKVYLVSQYLPATFSPELYFWKEKP